MTFACEDSRILSPLSASGDVRTAALFPVFGKDFSYDLGLPTESIVETEGVGSDVSVSDGSLVLAATNADDEVALFRSVDRISPFRGTNQVVRISAKFTAISTLASSRQLIGIGDAEHGIFFGSVGTRLAIVLRKGDLDTETVIYQGSWNLDNGNLTTSDSVIQIIPQAGNIYQFEWSSLGFGAVTISILNPATNRFVGLHRVMLGNTDLGSLVLPRAHLPVSFESRGHSNSTTPSSLAVQAFEVLSDAPADRPERHGSTSTVKTIPAVEGPLLSVKNDPSYAGETNRFPVRLKALSFHPLLSGTDGRIAFRLMHGGTLTGDSFSAPTSSSHVSVDTSATVLTDGVEILTGIATVKASEGAIEMLLPDGLLFAPGQIMTILASEINGGAIASMLTRLEWEERR